MPSKLSLQLVGASQVLEGSGYQVGYVFTYLGMYTHLFQKLGM